MSMSLEPHSKTRERVFLTREREDEYFFDEKAAIKREESGACSDYPEREQARPKVNYNLGDTVQIQSKTKI